MIVQMRGGVEASVTQERQVRYTLVNGHVVEQVAFVTRIEALELMDVLKRRGVIQPDATL